MSLVINNTEYHCQQFDSDFDGECESLQSLDTSFYDSDSNGEEILPCDTASRHDNCAVCESEDELQDSVAESSSSDKEGETESEEDPSNKSLPDDNRVKRVFPDLYKNGLAPKKHFVIVTRKLLSDEHRKMLRKRNILSDNNYTDETIQKTTQEDVCVGNKTDKVYDGNNFTSYDNLENENKMICGFEELDENLECQEDDEINQWGENIDVNIDQNDEIALRNPNQSVCQILNKFQSSKDVEMTGEKVTVQNNSISNSTKENDMKSKQIIDTVISVSNQDENDQATRTPSNEDLAGYTVYFEDPLNSLSSSAICITGEVNKPKNTLHEKRADPLQPHHTTVNPPEAKKTNQPSVCRANESGSCKNASVIENTKHDSCKPHKKCVFDLFSFDKPDAIDNKEQPDSISNIPVHFSSNKNINKRRRLTPPAPITRSKLTGVNKGIIEKDCDKLLENGNILIVNALQPQLCKRTATNDCSPKTSSTGTTNIFQEHITTTPRAGEKAIKSKNAPARADKTVKPAIKRFG